MKIVARQSSLLVLSALTMACQMAWAQSDTPTETAKKPQAEQLETINVRASARPKAVANKTTTYSNQTLRREMIRDQRDLVRYTADMGTTDQGRIQRGFAVRGVEGNRVGISIDGIDLPQFESNSLYEKYGNFNSSRVSVDMEMVRSTEITRGSDSFTNGSGALGGNVSFQTLRPSDLVRGEDPVGGLYRVTYNQKSRQWINTAGMAYMNDSFEAILMGSKRHGHELYSRGSGNIEIGSGRSKPDPLVEDHESVLGKVKYRITPEHAVGLNANYMDRHVKVKEYSYTLLEDFWRKSDDTNKLVQFQGYYQYTPTNSWLKMLDLSTHYMDTQVNALNYQGYYSRGDEPSEVKDRRMYTTLYKFQGNGTTHPIDWHGSHVLNGKVYVSRRDFSVLNLDRVFAENTWHHFRETIQYPSRTTQKGMSLKDDVTWQLSNGRQLVGHFGLRLDHEQITPRPLNANCTMCEKAPKPYKVTYLTPNILMGLDFKPNKVWTLSYVFSTGHRNPTSSELFFMYENPYGIWEPNPNLKPERSFDQSIFVKSENKYGELGLRLYRTDYRQFLFETGAIRKTKNPDWDKYPWYQQYMTEYYYSQVNTIENMDRAYIMGLEFQSTFKFKSISQLWRGLEAKLNVGYSRGRMSNNYSLLSVQPYKMVLGLDYNSPLRTWSVFTRLSYLGAKKPKDAMIRRIQSKGLTFYETTEAFPYLNKQAWVFDIFGYHRPRKNVTMRIGVYNVFNKKYQTWDRLRGINLISTTNVVDSEGYGLQRYYEPGRMFSAGLEIVF